MRKIMLLLLLSLPATASAADLAGHSRLGAVFAEPVKARRGAVAEKPRPVEEPVVAYAPEVDVRPLVNGYYGKPNSYYYRSYYGTRPETIFSRAPYACGFYGYC